MTFPESKTPLAVRMASVLIILVLIVFCFSVLRSVLIPLAFSLLLSVLLYPLCQRLEQWRLPRIWAIVVCLVVAIGVVGGVVTFISMQIMGFSESLPQFIERTSQLLGTVQIWVEQTFHVKQSNQIPLLKNSLTEWAKTHGSVFTNTLSATTATLGTITLLPLFMFFFLLYRDFFRNFFHQVFRSTGPEKVNMVLHKIQQVIKSYVLGLGMVIVIVAALNVTGLLILGIDYAVFFGVLGALLTIIPYAGILIGSLLPILMALITKDSPWYAVGVAGVFFLVQLLEGNFITPNVVGSKVSVNPLAAIVGLILGGMLWGASGMILALPFIAVLKVVFDSVESLEPYGYVLGESSEVVAQDKAVPVSKLAGQVKHLISPRKAEKPA